MKRKKRFLSSVRGKAAGPRAGRADMANSAGNWRLTIGPEKELEVGKDFKACLIVSHNLGPGKCSVVQATGRGIDIAPYQIIVTQVEYGFKFVGAKDKPAQIEFQILPVLPWSFWRVSDTAVAPKS